MKTPLDPGFEPTVMKHREHRLRASEPLVIVLERESGRYSRYETTIDKDAPDARRYAERTVKFLLWSRGGRKLYFGGPEDIGEHIRRGFAEGGERAFDADIMSRIYGETFQVDVMPADEVPDARETPVTLGGHLDGCRIGFDLGASDYKVAAVQEGEVLYSDEFPWNPKDEKDPDYHYEHLTHGLKQAAAHLPRVDAIGGSSAGAVVDNRMRIASLFRSVPSSLFGRAADMFLRIGKEWNVPIQVANDGEITALAGAMSLKVSGLLGIAMGSSEATGYIDETGHMTGWLNELAFAPVDEQPGAAVDEWSGDRGVGALYFSQQAVSKLLPAAGIALPEDMPLPERLKEVQALMEKDDPRARKIYQTIGSYLGYSIPQYGAFYAFQHLLLLGRVTTGEGGNILIAAAREVLTRDFPETAETLTIHVPDEKSRRVGQAVAAASLPAIDNPVG